MPPTARKRRNSDSDYAPTRHFSRETKKLRHRESTPEEDQEGEEEDVDIFQQTSSAPSSPIAHLEPADSDMLGLNLLDKPYTLPSQQASISNITSLSPIEDNTASGSTLFPFTTLHSSTSPTRNLSTLTLPDSSPGPLDTPVHRHHIGRPQTRRVRKELGGETNTPRTSVYFQNQQKKLTERIRSNSSAKLAQRKATRELSAAQRKEMALELKHQNLIKKRDKALQFIANLTKPEGEEDGLSTNPWRGQALLTQSMETPISEHLRSFSMMELSNKIQEIAPNIWKALNTIMDNPEKTAAPRHEKLVLTTVCAMFARLRSQKANNFHAVIALFLIGSGSAKREMEVFAHAGLSLSYVAAIRYLNQLSREATRKYQELIKQCMMMIVWDNLNIAFRVAAQQHDSKDHFDNGTTLTVLPIWDPINCSTRTPYGTLPLDMKPPRTTTNPTFQWSAMQVLPTQTDINQLHDCLIWQLKHLAMEQIGGLEHLKSSFEACPTVDPIAVHVTEQYPLPALHEEESSIEGTITVYVSILRNLGMTNEDLKAHGLLFNDGDLLTDLWRSLKVHVATALSLLKECRHQYADLDFSMVKWLDAGLL
ncbi:hypothetical protein EV359DRAFT_83958 [Lentinula novae-zelandiae]|nr:hypothetical protein EV359DRAFT_83958 [Lentinula novae-zelandiae]